MIDGIWFILPAYVASGLAVWFGFWKPIDLNRKFWDNERLFGDGKTFFGFAGGVILGTLIGIVQTSVQSDFNFGFHMTAELGFLIAFGAMAGDLAGSFIKRRLKIKRGEMAPLLDQLDFVIGALFFGFMAGQLPCWNGILIIFILTPLLHLFWNRVAFMVKIKEYPW